MEVKLFTGVRLTADVKYALVGSSLDIITFEQKEYIGLYAPKNPTLDEIHQLSSKINATLHQCLPGHRHLVVVFPQLFVG